MDIVRFSECNLFHTVDDGNKLGEYIENYLTGFDNSNKVYAMTLAYVVMNSVARHYNTQLDKLEAK